MKKIFLCYILLILISPAFSQETSTSSDTLRKDALNVFMQTSDYIRKEIPYVNYVRDMKDAGVYIISTSERTGSGGREYTYFLVGQNENAGMRDTISFVTSPDETQDERRIKEVRTLKMGLMRYIAKTPLSKYMNISFTEPLSETVSSDNWDSWVFRSRINGYLDGQQSYKTTYLNGNISASRITKDWKINLNAMYNYSVDKIDVDNETITSDNKRKSISALIVKSISDHWSYGGSFYIGSSSYSNLNMSTTIMPGIEYDLFPYSESTRRQLRLLYSIGYNYVNYTDTTIFNLTREGHMQHSFSASYEVVQKWGTIDLSMEYSNYLHDWSKNNLSLHGFLDLRIAKGFSVNFGGGASLIHDQLGLVKGGATTEEILLQRKELATQFQYFTSFGFTFTFGSIYNNVVNPRFGNSGGGGMTIMMN
ncbi:MAG: DUF481 domain-containing protein [Bacteroidales bacterium]|nr:DUF481 domain-containing protein [Bacteroidales bacterium]